MKTFLWMIIIMAALSFGCYHLASALCRFFGDILTALLFVSCSTAGVLICIVKLLSDVKSKRYRGKRW